MTHISLLSALLLVIPENAPPVMDGVLHTCPVSITSLRTVFFSSASQPSSVIRPRFLLAQSGHHLRLPLFSAPPVLSFFIKSGSRSPSDTGSTSVTKSSSPRSGMYTVGEFMTRKEDLRVVKPMTTVDEALEMLVENRITGFPVIDDNWKLVGLVSDYDLLALDSISGGARANNNMFPEVDSTWKTFNEVQKLLSKTNGKVVGDLMTPAPVVVQETSNLEDAAKLLLETKYRRLPVVDSDGKLVGIITRGNVVRAALQIKRAGEIKGLSPTL